MEILMTNNLQPQQKYLMKSNNVSLDCISELCNATDSTVATVHEKFTASDWNIKIWQDATCELHCI